MSDSMQQNAFLPCQTWLFSLSSPTNSPMPVPMAAFSPVAVSMYLRRSLTDLFATDPECAAKAPERKLAGGLARSMAFAGAGIDDELELKKLQAGSAPAAFLHLAPYHRNNASGSCCCQLPLHPPLACLHVSCLCGCCPVRFVERRVFLLHPLILALVPSPSWSGLCPHPPICDVGCAGAQGGLCCRPGARELRARDVAPFHCHRAARGQPGLQERRPRADLLLHPSV